MVQLHAWFAVFAWFAMFAWFAASVCMVSSVCMPVCMVCSVCMVCRLAWFEDLHSLQCLHGLPGLHGLHVCCVYMYVWIFPVSRIVTWPQPMKFTLENYHAEGILTIRLSWIPKNRPHKELHVVSFPGSNNPGAEWIGNLSKLPAKVFFAHDTCTGTGMSSATQNGMGILPSMQ